ncbi:MAG TPA: hypothetical protein VFZ85_08235 [Jiangellaceae bacterium]
MDADSLRDAPNAEPDSTNHRLDLIARMHDHSRSVIDAEMQRLSRRVPTLGLADMEVITEALEHLSGSLILHRLRNAPQDTTPLLWRLFGTVADSRDTRRP